MYLYILHWTELYMFNEHCSYKLIAEFLAVSAATNERSLKVI